MSHDIDLRRPLDLDGGGTATALEIQGQYLEWLAKYVESELDEPVFTQVIDEWASVLDDLERDPMSCADRLDWVAKKRLLDAYRQRDGLDWSSAKLAAISLQFHDLDPEAGLFQKLQRSGRIRRLFDDDEVTAALAHPPERTRAYFRGTCVDRFADDVVAANWDSLVFDIGEPHLKRVPMMEPLKGGRDTVGEMLDSVDTAAELIQALGD